MRERYCCDDMCRQGRDCPNRTGLNLSNYQMRYYNLWQWIKGLFDGRKK